MAAQSRPQPYARSAPAGALVYAKTEAGRAMLASPRASVAVRERQILLLCTGERDADALGQVFGPGIGHELQQLVAQGLVEARPREPLPMFTPTLPPEPSTAFSLTLPPLGLAAYSANQSGFLPASVRSAHAEVVCLLAEMGGDDATQWLQSHLDAECEDDVLAMAARAIGLAEQAWGQARAIDRASRIAQLLPRPAIARLLDALIDHASGALVADAYALWLSDSAFGHEGPEPSAA
ncbi:MAG: hypothetical protein Q4G71_01025 [Pseudomonadota bacterium]|nr:hypothetical protein [Pseudomonadota bacterium]